MLHQVSRISWIGITSSLPRLHQSPILRHAHSWEQRALGTNQKERQMASCYTASFTSLKPSFHRSLHGLFSDCTLLVLAVAHNRKKNLIVVDLLVCNDFQRQKENIKKQLIWRRAKERRSRPGLRRDWCYLPRDLKMQKKKKNMEKMAFSVTSAHLCRWMSDGREEGTNKGGLQSA